MRFHFDGKLFAIDFSRGHETVYPRMFGAPKVLKTPMKSAFPYTTVTLFEVLNPNSEKSPRHNYADFKFFSAAKVGCCPSDHYSLEAGRLAALRKLTKRLKEDGFDKGFFKAMWTCYNNRGEKGGVVPPSSSWSGVVPPTSCTALAVIPSSVVIDVKDAEVVH